MRTSQVPFFHSFLVVGNECSLFSGFPGSKIFWFFWLFVCLSFSFFWSYFFSISIAEEARWGSRYHVIQMWTTTQKPQKACFISQGERRRERIGKPFSTPSLSSSISKCPILYQYLQGIASSRSHSLTPDPCGNAQCNQEEGLASGSQQPLSFTEAVFENLWYMAFPLNTSKHTA